VAEYNAKPQLQQVVQAISLEVFGKLVAELLPSASLRALLRLLSSADSCHILSAAVSQVDRGDLEWMRFGLYDDPIPP
jgi:hypothetical protein